MKFYYHVLGGIASNGDRIVNNGGVKTSHLHFFKFRFNNNKKYFKIFVNKKRKSRHA